MLCLAPILLMGYLLTMQPNSAHVSNVDGTIVEVMTCDRGLGLHVKASSTGLYGTGLQYGMQTEVETGLGVMTLTFLPKAGLSYSDQARRELPMQGQFECGGQALVGIGLFQLGLEYWHLSNAGMKAPNIGLDMIVIQTGWRF